VRDPYDRDRRAGVSGVRPAAGAGMATTRGHQNGGVGDGRAMSDRCTGCGVTVIREPADPRPVSLLRPPLRIDDDRAKQAVPPGRMHGLPAPVGRGRGAVFTLPAVPLLLR
jgi:hypothetical protein